jgi:glycosyltransferase involved in cell wall biosynthesis
MLLNTDNLFNIMTNPKVSIIVTCFNLAKYLDEALQSIFNQTYPNWECMIVDDGSTDNSGEIAREWETKDPRFVYLYKENGGVSSARNLGIEKAKQDYILTLDADDKYEASFLDKAMKVLVSDEQLGIVSSWGQYFVGDQLFQVYRLSGKSTVDFLFYNDAVGTSLFRKKCWEQVGGYDGNPKNGYEDWEFYLRVCALGWKAHVIEEVLFFYRQHIVSRRKEMNIKENENKKYIFIKNKSIYFDHYEAFVDRYLAICDKEKAENNKYANTIDYKIGATILKPFRKLKWFCINLLNRFRI